MSLIALSISLPHLHDDLLTLTEIQGDDCVYIVSILTFSQKPIVAEKS